MGASATLSPSVTTAVPGHEVTCPVVVVNTGTVVDQFTVTVVGDAAPWTTVDPPVVGLMPGQSATVTLRFAPPRQADTPAGPVPFAVRVASQEEPHGSVVEEGTVEVAAFAEVALELSPTTVEGATTARFEVVVDNAGNHPVDVELRHEDQGDGLDFRAERSRFTLDAGTAAFIALRVRPRKRFLRGPSVRHQFRVHAVHSGGDPLVADGVMVQRQLLPKWLVPALIALLLLAGLLVALWFAVLRPAVKSAATAAAAEQATELKAQAQQAGQEAAQAKEQAAEVEQKANKALEAAGFDLGNLDAPPTTTVPPAPAAAQPTDFRIAANVPIGTNTTTFREIPYTPGDGSQALLLTDLILQNPGGHTGLMRVLREFEGERTVLLEFGLANFRDHDYHWVQPLRFAPGERIILAVNCQNPAPAGNCTPAASFSGLLESVD